MLKTPPDLFRNGQVQLSWARLSDYKIENLKYISLEEHKRISLFPSRERALGFAVGRHELRSRVASMLDIDPHKIHISYSVHGKPYIEDLSVQFSISHTQNFCAIAISQNYSVGIDIEFKSKHRDFLKISKRYFKSKLIQDRLAELPGADANDLFFSLWCAHEAIVKMKAGSVFNFDETKEVLEQIALDKPNIQNLELLKNCPPDIAGAIASQSH